MRWRAGAVILAAMMATQLWATDDMTMPSLEKLAQRAKESVDVTLDSSTLQLASEFLSSEDPDQARVKKLVGKLKGVYVRTFEFDREGQYSASDVEAVRGLAKGPGWTRIVGVKSLKEDNAEVYLKKDGSQVGGIVVIDAEPKELTVVHIEGPINPEELSELAGHMGIPKLGKEKTKTEKGSNKGDQ
ncbi:MAG TPA: DUF4252 domain-containing protein [Bryobacteraceae bacterium]|nr:DUF4252 domain-containing protein [Bryobacteraceae bacterium]